MKLTIVGLGYVGASTAALFSQRHRVTAIEISADKLDHIRSKRSPVGDDDLVSFFAKHKPDIIVPKDNEKAYRDSDYILIATPTNYEGASGHLETDSVETVIEEVIRSGGDARIVIKSTIPTGFMRKMQDKYPDRVFLYVPEFLREGSAIHDQLHPSRIVIGLDEDSERSEKAADLFIDTLLDCIEDKDAPILRMSFGEAEAVKLFSNTYLAMRVAFFNELDTLAEHEEYDTRKIIEGVCLDPRIGDWYNNPSFGYGGYCLPKDTKQLLAHYDELPQKLIYAVVASNNVRKDYVTKQIVMRLREVCKGNGKEGSTDQEKPVVGIYRLVMKSGSKNFRESSVLDVIDRLVEKGIDVIIYEPVLSSSEEFDGIEVIEELNVFKQKSDLIVANRFDALLDDVKDKVYTRDIFRNN